MQNFDIWGNVQTIDEKESCAVYRMLGASNHSQDIRQTEDFYATDPRAVALLLDLEDFSPNVWECACGLCHITDVLKARGYNVFSTDIIDRGAGCDLVLDFLNDNLPEFDGDIITNPPYKFAEAFVYRAMDAIKPGRRVAMFLRLNFLEGKARKELFKKYPPQLVYVASGCLTCARNGEFDKNFSTAMAHAWIIWQKGYKGETT